MSAKSRNAAGTLGLTSGFAQTETEAADMAKDRDIAKSSEPEVAACATPEVMDGDASGPFGFGRPAHKPDPEAIYTFDPGPPRTMPILPKNRWR